jgi:hypothetical protein
MRKKSAKTKDAKISDSRSLGLVSSFNGSEIGSVTSGNRILRREIPIVGVAMEVDEFSKHYLSLQRELLWGYHFAYEQYGNETITELETNISSPTPWSEKEAILKIAKSRPPQSSRWRASSAPAKPNYRYDLSNAVAIGRPRPKTAKQLLKVRVETLEVPEVAVIRTPIPNMTRKKSISKIQHESKEFENLGVQFPLQSVLRIKPKNESAKLAKTYKSSLPFLKEILSGNKRLGGKYSERFMGDSPCGAIHVATPGWMESPKTSNDATASWFFIATRKH